MARKTAPRKPATRRTSASPTSEAGAFLKALEHPLKAEIEAVRAAVLNASPTITDGVKWNSVSFRTTEWFATVNWRVRDRVQLVLHLGAKVKDNTREGLSIDDPQGLLKWLAKDRCLVTLEPGKPFASHRRALTGIIRAWIKHVR